VNFVDKPADLDLSAPLDRYRGAVIKDWIDLNGHMNMAYYMIAFDKATDVLLEQLGLAADYTENELGMIFVLEAHLTYRRELVLGDPIRVSTQIIDHSPKLLHLFHHMYRGDEADVVAMNELLLIHIDFESRRSSPWPRSAMTRLEAMAAAHRALPVPAQAGSKIAIRG
jgi:acyl-CoA thioester hydrolase